MGLYQFKITLQDVNPPIWRRIVVPKDLTLHKFAFILEDAMQWFGIIIYRYILEKSIFVPDYEHGDDMTPVYELPLSTIIGCKDIEFEYNLDDDYEGLGWIHTIEYEGEIGSKIGSEIGDDSGSDIEGLDLPKVPVCIDGARACPPDKLKLNGFWGESWARGYDELVKIMKDRDHPEREQIMYFNYLKDDYDPDFFDKKIIKYRIATQPGMIVEYYDNYYDTHDDVPLDFVEFYKKKQKKKL